MNKLILSLTITAMAMTGCASVQLPPDQVQHLEGRLASAKKLAALDEPFAGHRVGAFGMSPTKEHLELAKDQAEVAKALAAGGDSRALLLLARAESDIDLAIGIARQGAMHRLALQADGELKNPRLARSP